MSSANFMVTGSIFELYKPFRNYLKRVQVSEALYVTWAYIQHLQLEKVIPPNIGTPPGFLTAQWPLKSVHEWELEIIAREAIINGEETLGSKTLRNPNYLAKTVNALKSLENNVDKAFTSKGNILHHLHRIAHRQFPWQERPNLISMARYFKIFSQGELETIVQDKIGLAVKELFLMGAALFGFYINKVALNYPPNIQIPGMTQAGLDRLLSVLSCDLSILRQKLVDERQMNENFCYYYHSLRAYPLVRMSYEDKYSLVCPIPTLLFWRITNGIYFEICTAPNFDNAFGDAFEDYVGEVIQKSCTRGLIKCFPEEQYFVGRDRKDTVDWILDDADAAIFVECKTKRLPVRAKSALSEAQLDEQLEIMASFVLQVYKTIKDYTENRYPSYKFQEEKLLFPLVVTLEDWYLYGDRSLGILDDCVRERFRDEGLSEAWLESMPYSVCSVREFELIAQIVQNTGIMLFMTRKVMDKERRMWPFWNFINAEFDKLGRETKFLFEADLRKIYPETVEG